MGASVCGVVKTSGQNENDIAHLSGVTVLDPWPPTHLFQQTPPSAERRCRAAAWAAGQIPGRLEWQRCGQRLPGAWIASLPPAPPAAPPPQTDPHGASASSWWCWHKAPPHGPRCRRSRTPPSTCSTEAHGDVKWPENRQTLDCVNDANINTWVWGWSLPTVDPKEVPAPVSASAFGGWCSAAVTKQSWCQQRPKDWNRTVIVYEPGLQTHEPGWLILSLSHAGRKESGVIKSGPLCRYADDWSWEPTQIQNNTTARHLSNRTSYVTYERRRWKCATCLARRLCVCNCSVEKSCRVTSDPLPDTQTQNSSASCETVTLILFKWFKCM